MLPPVILMQMPMARSLNPTVVPSELPSSLGIPRHVSEKSLFYGTSFSGGPLTGPCWEC